MAYVKKEFREKLQIYTNFYWTCTHQQLTEFLEQCHIENHFFVKIDKNKYQCTDGYIVECKNKKVGDKIYHAKNKMEYSILRTNANPKNFFFSNKTVNYIDTIFGELVQWSFIYQRYLNKEKKVYEIAVEKHPYYLSEIENGSNNFKMSYGMGAAPTGFYYHANCSVYHKIEWRVPTLRCTFNQRGFTLMGKDAIKLYPYTGFDYIEPHNSDWYDFEHYLNNWKRFPQIEQIVKLGFYGMLKDIYFVNEQFNFKGKSFKQITKLDKTFKELVKHPNFDKNMYELIDEYNFSPEETEMILNEKNLYYYYGSNKLYELNKNKFFNKYIPKNKRKQVLLFLVENSKKTNFRDYADTVEWLYKLGYPFRKRYVMSDNFNALHDQLMKEYALYKDSCYNEQIEQVANELKQYSYQNKKFKIEPFNSQTELIEESKALGHCIRNYAEKYANKQTELYKIRLTKNDSQPLFSLEFLNGKVLQCQGAERAEPPKEVVAFYMDWAEKIRRKGEIKNGKIEN